jgi:hypothetical protein
MLSHSYIRGRRCDLVLAAEINVSAYLDMIDANTARWYDVTEKTK